MKNEEAILSCVDDDYGSHRVFVHIEASSNSSRVRLFQIYLLLSFTKLMTEHPLIAYLTFSCAC